MKEVIAFYAAAKKGGMTTCAAIRATVIQLVDVPRTELQEILVEQCKMNSSTARTQIQAGRKQAAAQEPAPVATQATPPAKPAAKKRSE